MSAMNCETTSNTAPLFLSVPNTAHALGIGQTQCWKMLKERTLPCVKIGRRTLVPAAALAEFAASLTATSGR
jgi:excisionase family DNA binding protein